MHHGNPVADICAARQCRAQRVSDIPRPTDRVQCVFRDPHLNMADFYKAIAIHDILNLASKVTMTGFIHQTRYHFCDAPRANPALTMILPKELTPVE
jgi:hypothetical protein